MVDGRPPATARPQGAEAGVTRRGMLGACALGTVLLMAGCGGKSESAGTYYEGHQSDIRSDFEALLPAMRRRLSAVHGEAMAGDAIAGARRRADSLLPKVPYIGGSANELTTNLYQSAMALAIHQEMKARERPASETAEVIYRAFGDYLAEWPQAPLLKATGIVMRVARPRSSHVASSQYDWTCSDVAGDGTTFDWGVDYAQCGICTYLREHEAEDLLPYMCLLDFPVFKAMGVGLERTRTIARGNRTCDFRHNFDGRYHAEWEPFDLGL